MKQFDSLQNSAKLSFGVVTYSEPLKKKVQLFLLFLESDGSIKSYQSLIHNLSANEISKNFVSQIFFAVKMKAELIDRMKTKETPPYFSLAHWFHPKSYADQVGP